MHREKILESAGYRIVRIREQEWNQQKEAMPKHIRDELETYAAKSHIRPRDALKGGRTEVFQTYKRCDPKHERIYYFDIVSLYPTVNALDDYAIGFKQYINASVEDIKNEAFIGLVKCDAVPPKGLLIPLLPDNSKGKLLFHNEEMKEGTWTTKELKKSTRAWIQDN